MLHEAVSRYHELLTSDDLAEASRAMLDEGLERSKLIFNGRPSFTFLCGPTLSPKMISLGSSPPAKRFGRPIRKGGRCDRGHIDH